MSVDVEKKPQIAEELDNTADSLPEFRFNEEKARDADRQNTAFEFLRDTDSTKEMKRNRRYAQRSKRIAIISYACLSVFIAYTIFLIFGLVLTKYTYDNTGKMVPEVLTVQEIKDLKDFESLNTYYLRARNIYEDVLKLDYKLANDPNSSLKIAMEYTEELKIVDKLITDLRAAEYPPGYAAIYNQLLMWCVTTDGQSKIGIAFYLQKVSDAITNNNEESANDALLAKEMIQNDFATITSNMAQLANTVKGAEVRDLYTWTPTSFIESLETEG